MRLVVEGDRATLELAVVHAQGAAHDLAAARHDLVELGGHQRTTLGVGSALGAR